MNGIGGRTVAEAQERLSLSEFRLWMKYRNKYGSLNPMMRTEWGAALVASTIANVNRKENTPPFHVADFALHIELEEKPISLDEAKEKWS
ncbi:phage tail protein [Serratia proteamaculans]|uniref:phage tail assembly protein T n=1 Tax=Serratia proteamaculans TaxID=28151 RepID=UPI0029814158|nr:phage tail protein [Serratia proteamaculans]MDW5499861.1 phage tail protein [Serratia proteamaculans]